MLHLLLLLVNLLLLWMIYNRLIRLKLFTQPLVDGLLADLVVVAGLHLDHIFEVVYVTCVRILGVGSCPASSVLVDVHASISRAFAGNFQRAFVCWLHHNASLILLSTCDYRHPVVLELSTRSCCFSQILLAYPIRSGPSLYLFDNVWLSASLT